MSPISRLSNTITEENTYLDFVEGVGHDSNQHVKQDDHNYRRTPTWISLKVLDMTAISSISKTTYRRKFTWNSLKVLDMNPVSRLSKMTI